MVGSPRPNPIIGNKVVERIWAQAFPYLPKREKQRTREGWKGALVYIAPTNKLRRATLSHLTLTLVGVETEPGTVPIAIGALAKVHARKVLGEPLGYL